METTPPTKSAPTLGVTLVQVMAEHKEVRDPESSSCLSSYPDFRLLLCVRPVRTFFRFANLGLAQGISDSRDNEVRDRVAGGRAG